MGKASATRRPWDFAIDVGGTFTDCVATGPGGRIHRTKLLSTPGIDGPLRAIRQLMQLAEGQTPPPITLRFGTTRGTNALLTRTGAKVALATTRGFGDMLEIGYQDRPRLFDLTIRKTPPLASRVVEIEERIAADGQVLIQPDRTKIISQLSRLCSEGIESLAICLLHADLYPDHELLVEDAAREAGFVEISRSSEAAPLVKVVARGETTVVDAYLNPVLREYLAQLQAALPGSDVTLMTSAGGLVPRPAFRGSHSVLSGPAGGVVGYARLSRAAGFPRVIGFDMGGTSTDVSRYDGRYDYQFETRKAGVRLMTPTLAIDTVAAGGGSRCWFDGVKLCVGPESAGADPGPACYGRGGPLSVTDLNVYLGRLPADRFPLPLDVPAVETRLQQLQAELQQVNGTQLELDELAEGLLRIANANMADAIRNVTVAQGADPRDYVLAAFGGAAGQHACAVARELQIRSIILHEDAGILSARGLSLADVARDAARGLYLPATQASTQELNDIFAELCAPHVAELEKRGLDVDQIAVERTLDVRYEGVDTSLNVPYSPDLPYETAFAELHRRRYGYVQPDRPLELVAARTKTIGQIAGQLPDSTRTEGRRLNYGAAHTTRFAGVDRQTPVYHRTDLAPGDYVDGPAIVLDEHATIVVEPEWRCERMTGGELLLSDAARERRPDAALMADEVLLEVFNNLLAGIAERMGHVLRQTASSVNVKERLDYSCAVFTAEGRLAANAPHVPVHLGAMGATVRALMADHPDLQPGDVLATNDPYRGGSHLPDITVAAPVFDEQGKAILFWTACRAHHAEIGGVRPGSMPPMSKQLGEEGVVISSFRLVEQGVSREKQLGELLAGARYPSRTVAENLADLRAQTAAVHSGARDLRDLVEQYTLPVVEQQLQAIQDAAAEKLRRALAKLSPGIYRRTDYLETAHDEQLEISVAVELPQLAASDSPSRPAAVIDFAGTSPTSRSNFNANPAIVHAATLYVLRLLVDEEIPLNEGALSAVEIKIPPGLLNPQPAEPLEASPAVAAGNVETSQRIVDVLLGALELAAASQGTMNNLLLGNERFGYYETIAGGSGATADGPGADAVQVHMTNTRSTDPEILERRLPVRLWESRLRDGSGGQGRHPGGLGLIRCLEALEPLELSLITGRRGPFPPFGLAGGEPGALGENLLIRCDDSEEQLPGICQRQLAPGDRLIIRTPGGGGYGGAR